MAQRTRDTKDTYIGLLAAIVEVNGATSGRTRAILWTVRLPSNRFRKFKTLFKRLREFEFFFFLQIIYSILTIKIFNIVYLEKKKNS